MVATLLDNRAETVARLVDHAFDVIEDAFQAVKVVRHPNLQIEMPDHHVRFEAGRLFIKLVSIPRFNAVVSTLPPSAARPRHVAPASENGRSSRSRADYKARFESVRLLIRMLSKV